LTKRRINFTIRLMKKWQTLENLREFLRASHSLRQGRVLADRKTRHGLEHVVNSTVLDGKVHELTGKSILLAARDQLAAALALIELDGTAGRLVICPPGVPQEHLAAIANYAEVDAIVIDSDEPEPAFAHSCMVYRTSVAVPATQTESPHRKTEWVLLTSGTTGVPKMVLHRLASLVGPIDPAEHLEADIVWGTFYDIRRYAGMQTFLRALLGNGSLILSSSDESPAEHLTRLKANSVTHMNGTPSHWRRAFMCREARDISPRYIRLSGEIPDQTILNTLRSFYPNASIGQAYGSTEVGIAFETIDALEGFPASFVGAAGEVEVKVENSSVWVRSPRMAARYLGPDPAISDSSGFADTGDIVERRGDRYYFLGRRTGIINIGGLKVHPEEVEAQINMHPAVRMSCARPRRNPITGSVIVADVVLRNDNGNEGQIERIESEILQLCRERLPKHKVPVKLHFVSSLAVAEAGKIVRH
jgi:acyl-coenzyme A synthetase/AMP-(fatty) acid ligase